MCPTKWLCLVLLGGYHDDPLGKAHLSCLASDPVLLTSCEVFKVVIFLSPSWFGQL